MSSQAQEYEPLCEEGDCSDMKSCHASQSFPSRSTLPNKRNAIIFSTILLLSNIITCFLSIRLSRGSFEIVTVASSPYAHLARTVPVAFEESTPYTDPNEALANELWDRINIDAGMVALPADFATANGLPLAQRFPWDPSKGIYLLNGYHNLHCIRAIYISLQEFQQGVPQTRAWGHVIHCVDALRQDIICNADDTPRYSTASQSPESGRGQVRLCRSWDQLEGWARRYNSCYKYVNQTAEALPEIQRFIYCPRGSPYREEVARVFGEVPSYEDL